MPQRPAGAYNTIPQQSKTAVVGRVLLIGNSTSFIRFVLSLLPNLPKAVDKRMVNMYKM